MEMNSNEESQWVDTRMAALEPEGEWQPDRAAAVNRLADSRRQSNQRWTAAAILTTTACVLFLAFPATRVFARQCLDACLSPFTGGSTAAPSQIAPEFVLQDVEGKQVRLSDYKGKVVLVNFWATWCPPCKVEIPWFIEMQQAYRDRGLVILGISLDDDGREVVKPFAEENRINYPMLLGNDSVSRAYGGVESLPTSFVIDREGRVAATHLGLVSRRVYEREIESLLTP